MLIVNYATRRCAGWGSRGRWEQEELLGTLLGSLLDLHSSCSHFPVAGKKSLFSGGIHGGGGEI